MRVRLSVMCLIFGMILTGTLQASTKLSHQLFKVSSRTLPNGLHIIEQPASRSDTLTLQLVVDVGFRDFPCAEQQIPHVIEHALFENNTRFNPEELRQQVRDLGGFSIGYTTDETTFYTLSIHSDHADRGVDTLLTMLQDIRWDEQDLDRVRRIVDTELEIPVSPVQRWYDSRRVLFDLAKGQLYPDTTLACTERSAAAGLTLTQVKAAFEQHYRAGAMTVIIVGSLPDAARQTLEEHLVRLPASTGETRFHPGPPINATPLLEKSGFGSATAYVNLLTRSPGFSDVDMAPMLVLTEYFNERLFADVRLKYGLGYTPKASLITEADQGSLLASTKTRSDQVDATRQLFEQIYTGVRERGIPGHELSRLKRKLVLSFETKERDSQQVAELYRMYRRWIRRDGAMPDLIAQFDAVTSEDVRRVAIRYLPERPVMAILRPPNQAEASITVTGIIVIAALLAWPLNRWIQRRRAEDAAEDEDA